MGSERFNKAKQEKQDNTNGMSNYIKAVIGTSDVKRLAAKMSIPRLVMAGSVAVVFDVAFLFSLNRIGSHSTTLTALQVFIVLISGIPLGIAFAKSY